MVLGAMALPDAGSQRVLVANDQYYTDRDLHSLVNRCGWLVAVRAVDICYNILTVLVAVFVVLVRGRSAEV